MIYQQKQPQNDTFAMRNQESISTTKEPEVLEGDNGQLKNTGQNEATTANTNATAKTTAKKQPLNEPNEPENIGHNMATKANSNPETAEHEPKVSTQIEEEEKTGHKSSLGITEKKTFKSGAFTIELSCLPDERTLVEITYSGGIVDETCSISEEEQLK